MKDKKIICDGCDWSWKLSEGGKDPYLCHKCGNDNTKKYLNENLKIVLTEKQIKRILPLLNEYYQQAVKKYVNKLTEDDFIELKRIMGDSPYFRVGADLFFHFQEFNNNQDSNLLLVKRLFDNLQKYDKKIFPLKYEVTDYNNETNVHGQHVMDLYSKLENRQRLVDQFKSLPSIGQRNLGYLKKIVIDDEYRPNTYTDRLRVLNRLVKTLPDNERGNRVLNKIFNNKNDLDMSLAIAEQFAMGFDENINKDELINKLSEFNVEIIQNSDNIVVYIVDDHETFIHLTCNSEWCFSRPGSSQHWNDYAESGFVYVVFNFEKEFEDSEFMNVILPDNLYVYTSSNVAIEEFGYDSVSYLYNIGVNVDTIFNDIDQRKKEEIYESKDGHYVEFNNIVDEDISLEVWDNGTYLELEKIVVPKSERKQGIGTKIMRYLIDYADNNNKDMYLTPDTSLGGTSFNRLLKFYKKFGFVRNKDQSISHYMVYHTK